MSSYGTTSGQTQASIPEAQEIMEKSGWLQVKKLWEYLHMQCWAKWGEWIWMVSLSGIQSAARSVSKPVTKSSSRDDVLKTLAPFQLRWIKPIQLCARLVFWETCASKWSFGKPSQLRTSIPCLHTAAIGDIVNRLLGANAQPFGHQVQKTRHPQFQLILTMAILGHTSFYQHLCSSGAT